MTTSEPSVERLHSLRTRGPFEEWLARTGEDSPFPGVVALRLPHPGRADIVALSGRLTAAAGVAKIVEHHHVLQCFGTVDLGPAGTAQVLEVHTGTDLEQLLAFVREQPDGIAPPLAAWIVRQVAEAVAHAHSLGHLHGSLTPSGIALLPDGQVKLDFALAGATNVADDATLTDLVDLRYVRADDADPARPKTASTDLYALGAILLEAITGEPPGLVPFTDDATAKMVGVIPEPIRDALAMALTRTATSSVADFALALTRGFYAGLGAEDERDGRGVLHAWLERMGGTDPELASVLTDHADTLYPSPARPSRGEYTQAIEARNQPVQPRDFSTDDFVSTSAPGWEDNASGTEASPVVLPVGPDAIATQAIDAASLSPLPTPLAAPPAPLGPPLGTTPAPMKSSHSSLAEIARRNPSRATWFLTGFAVTLVGMVVARMWFAG